MKIMTLATSLLLLVCSSFAYAGSGKAILPMWQAGSGTYKTAVMYVSNITDDTINVTFTVYGKDGTPVTPTTYYGFTNGNTQLAANSSGFISLTSSASYNQGYAIVEWSDTTGNDNAVAMVAHSYTTGASNGSLRSDFSVTVNSGMPF